MEVILRVNISPLFLENESNEPSERYKTNGANISAWMKREGTYWEIIRKGAQPVKREYQWPTADLCAEEQEEI